MKDQNTGKKAKELLDKFAAGNASPDEIQQVEQWYASYSQTPVEYDLHQRKELKAAIYSAINSKTGRLSKTFSWYRSVPKIAAILALPFAIGLIWWYVHSESKTLANKIEYTSAGQRKRIELSDGSVIWLNAKSSISFPVRFTEKVRLVRLNEGEAFFSVKHNPAKPFVVETNENLKTTVLGTSFNIQSYPTSDEITIKILTGKVNISKGNKLLSSLVKDQMITYYKKSQKIEQHTSYNGNAWTKGQLIFDGQSLIDITNQLERIYNIQIEVAGDISPNLKIAGSFNDKQKPEEIIKVICKLHDLKYETKNNQISIFKN